jgi:hypothetical protein
MVKKRTIFGLSALQLAALYGMWYWGMQNGKDSGIKRSQPQEDPEGGRPIQHSTEYRVYYAPGLHYNDKEKLISLMWQ